MNSELKIFNNTEFGEIRTIEVNGQPYFVASDVAKILHYAIPHKAVRDHCKGVLKQNILTSGGNQEVLIIPESDVYRLIFNASSQSNSKDVREVAERFENWVMTEVLPSIRKNGGYIANQENLSDEELMAKAVLVAQNTIAAKNKVISQQSERIEEMRPKEIFADAVAASHTSILVGDLAKLLKQNGVDIGQNRLFAWLRENGYLIKREGADWNMPTQRSMDMGLFEVKESTVNNPDGSVRINKTTKVTGKGQVYFVQKFLQDQQKKGGM